MASFDFGEYSAAQEEEDLAPLSWRDDPEKSLSDWTITILKKGRTDATYNVMPGFCALEA